MLLLLKVLLNYHLVIFIKVKKHFKGLIIKELFQNSKLIKAKSNFINLIIELLEVKLLYLEHILNFKEFLQVN